MQHLSKWFLSAAIMGSQAGLALAGGQADPMPVMPVTPAPVMTAPVILGADYGYDSGSDGGRGGSLIADVGFMVLTPKWKDNPAMFSFDTKHTTAVTSQLDFQFESQFVPSIALGFISGGGLGFRASWWGFSREDRETGTVTNDSSLISAASPLQLSGPFNNVSDLRVSATTLGGSVSTQAELRMDVWDFEAVASFSAGAWSALVSGGIRYAHVAQEYNAYNLQGNPPGTPLLARQFLASGHNFNGAGPLFALEGRGGIASTGLYIYGKGRAACLFGTSEQSAAVGRLVRSNNGVPPGVAEVGNSRSESVIPIGELDVGVGFQRETRMGVVFAQVGLVGQVWGGIGNSSESSGRSDFNQDVQSSITRDGTLGLIGFSVNAGIGY